ncbi:hypothetical protein BDZ45DRAFT_696805 [Acephala macrosclerotiorum]|nr:hypothetical protein BDZ45DRAFT_696805 [Acephala macrosclerotiorum]
MRFPILCSVCFFLAATLALPDEQSRISESSADSPSAFQNKKQQTSTPCSSGFKDTSRGGAEHVRYGKGGIGKRDMSNGATIGAIVGGVVAMFVAAMLVLVWLSRNGR